MAYAYSAFISYRRNSGEEKFMKNFNKIIRSEGQRVTNLDTFFDDISINWGEEFDTKIYNAIHSSFFFIPLFHNTYLHKDNLWCAKELYRALEVEKRIRESVSSDYCFILPIIERGTADSLPECVNKKNAIKLKPYQYHIRNGIHSKALENFKCDLYDTLLENLNKIGNFDISEICADIEIPADDEIIKWIAEVNEKIAQAAAEHVPSLKRNQL